MSKKNSKSAKKLNSAPVEEKMLPHDTEFLITRSDISEVFKFYDFFNVPLDPTLQAIKLKLDAGGVFTLQDQADIKKILAADISKGSHEVWHDAPFLEIRAECAETLVEIVKREVAEDTKRLKTNYEK